MHVTFASGGARALPYLGILKVPGIYDTVRVLDGTSAGALIVLLLALRVSYDDGFKLCTESLPMLFHPMGIASFFRVRGLFHWETMRDVLVRTLGDDMRTMTFHDLFQRTGLCIAIHAVDVARRRPKVFSHRATPDTVVVEAVCASCCIPVLFTPVMIGGKLYVDGALSARWRATEEGILCVTERVSGKTMGYFEQLFDLLRPVEPDRPVRVVEIPNGSVDVLGMVVRMMHGERPFDKEGRALLHQQCDTVAKRFRDETQKGQET